MIRDVWRDHWGIVGLMASMAGGALVGAALFGASGWRDDVAMFGAAALWFPVYGRIQTWLDDRWLRAFARGLAAYYRERNEHAWEAEGRAKREKRT